MARSQSLLTPEPSHIVRQPVTICHVQLRDLIICPDERGVVNYVQDQSIMERDLTDPSSAQTPLVSLNYVPNTIASLNIPDSDERLLAAGGQDAELHLSIHSRQTSRKSSGPPSHGSRRLWQYDGVLSGSINNSVLLTSLSLTRSNESSAEPRVAVSNNDCTVKFFDVNVRGAKGVDGPPKRISEAGTLRLDVPVNHSSISPDGRTLLSVGDSPQVYLHGMTGGDRITFTPLARLTLPSFDTPVNVHPSHSAGALPASFCTAFSPSGSKFAVASQEGMVAVWDVRSGKPMKVFTTDRSRAPPGGMSRSGSRATGNASGWLYEDSWDWTMPGHKAPGWGVRNVKFNTGIGGKEIMTFTEHTSLLHVIDATTFEHEETIRVPAIVNDPPQPSSPRPTSTSTSAPLSPLPNHQTQSYLRARPTSDDAWTVTPSPLPPRLPHIPVPHLHTHTHPHGHGHYYHRSYNPAPSPLGHTGAVSERRLRVRVRQIRDVPMATSLPSAGSQATPTSTFTLPSPRRRSHTEVVGAGASVEMDVDVDTDDGEEGDEAEVETDCLTSRAPSRAASPPLPLPPRSRPLAATVVHSGVGREMDVESGEAEAEAEGAIVVGTPPHLDLAGTCFDPRGAWLYVASTAGIVEWGVRGGEKRWWGEAVWA